MVRQLPSGGAGPARRIGFVLDQQHGLCFGWYQYSDVSLASPCQRDKSSIDELTSRRASGQDLLRGSCSGVETIKAEQHDTASRRQGDRAERRLGKKSQGSFGTDQEPGQIE